MLDKVAGDEEQTSSLTLDLPSFLRLFDKRGSSIMWFLGAGASRAAGVKTSWDMIWDFKRSIYRSHKKIQASALPDAADWKTRKLLQQFFDTEGGYPPAGDPAEYAAYFEAAYPSELDRRRYIEDMVANAKPSFGHHALAALMSKELCQVVWTTNFDRVMEDAAARRFNTTGRLSQGGLGEPEIVTRAIDEGSWPVYAKIHGDFQSVALKNTQDELRNQDKVMRQALVDACRSRGLAVIGYSGRDETVMAAFRCTIDEGGFRQGLFWFLRSDDETFSGVTELIEYARAKGVEAFLVKAESFDEVFSDLLSYVPAMEGVVDSFREEEAGRRTRIRPFGSVATFPVVRTNAFPITTYPQLARLIDCTVGGFKETRAAVEEARVEAVTARIGAGVIAFGADSALRAAFKSFAIENWDTHGIVPGRLYFESGERTLLREALFLGITRKTGLQLMKRRGETLVLADSDKTPPTLFKSLSYPLTSVVGTVSGTSLVWREACAIRLDFRKERLWLLLDPRVVIEWPDEASQADRDKAKDFVRERMANRYNKLANAMLDGWKQILIGKGEEPVTITAVPHEGGLGAVFEISPISGYSGRVK